MDQKTYGLLSITRKLGAHYLERVGNDDLLTEDAIAICLPFGNSMQDCIKLKFYKNKFYISIIKILSDNEGIGIISPFETINEILKNKFDVIIELITILSDKLNHKSEILSNLIDFKGNDNILFDVANIESALISILINKKVFLLDNNYTILSLLQHLISIFPLKFHKLFDFTINSKSYTENVNLMSISSSDIQFEDLENMKNENNTIIDVQNKICFGIYSSPFFSSLISNLKLGNRIKVKEDLTILEELIFNDKGIKLKKNSITKSLKLSKTDMKLFEKMKLNLLDLPQTSNIFEELIK